MDTIQLLIDLPQNLRSELLLLEGKNQGPRGLRAALVVVGVGCLDVTVLRERIIVYSGLDEVVSEEYGHHRRSLDILRSIQQLPQTRNNQSHILFRHTSQMEGIVRHLRGRLPYALRSY